MILIFAAFMSGVFATSNRLVGQLNETGTWILLSENEAKIGSSFFNLFGKNETINIQNCNAKEIVTEKDSITETIKSFAAYGIVHP